MSEPVGRYVHGGDGSHWATCHESHWDCRIVKLEAACSLARHKIEQTLAGQYPEGQALEAALFVINEVMGGTEWSSKAGTPSGRQPLKSASTPTHGWLAPRKPQP